MEPIHKTRQDAISWVHENTDNKVFRSNLLGEVVRVDARGTVMLLTGAGDNTWYWDQMREMD